MSKTAPRIPASAWFKSSYSGANTTECVEAARLSDGVAVRDSKTPESGRLTFSSPIWSAFLDSVR
ncbi:DUF397 domain-containing protein [Streptomyces sp. NPDC006283]|uniref:DUF397 domain-containing protein n=1 Tax=Streptomyces sp. NPDC006283 TaxID=3156741 RepID=UPI0033AF63C3